ncbi:MAG: excalibur calcium-binding domain-containing protein, partial [Actinomycetota bacterium]
APPRAVVAAAGAALDRLVVEPEGYRPGYDRGLFVHWVDDDGDGCDTRCEVLAAERRTDLPGLTVGWLSIYDGYSTDDSSELDIDHVVALAEAWSSGAWAWDAARRRAFANDLGDPRALIAVTAATNRSKSDRDPAQWQPPNRAAWCEFADAWIATKLRWGLTVDPAERAALANMLAGCPAGAPVTPVPAAPAAPAAPSGGGSGGAGVYYANCTAARAAGAAPVRAGDPGYRPALDRDGDGVGCE